MPIKSNYVVPPSHPSLHSDLSKKKTYSSLSNSKIKTKKNQVKSKLNVILHKKQSQSELAQYHHATCLYPITTKFVKAIDNNHFTTWPGLNSNLLRKYLSKST